MSIGRAVASRTGALARSRRLGIVSLAVLVGVGAGLGAVLFRFMIEGGTRLFTGYLDYAAVPGSPHGYLPGVGRWFVVLTPVVAGLLYGPLVYRFAREARGHGRRRRATPPAGRPSRSGWW